MCSHYPLADRVNILHALRGEFGWESAVCEGDGGGCNKPHGTTTGAALKEDTFLA